MRGSHWTLLAGLVFVLVFFVAGCAKEYPAELMEAKAAVADSKAEGAQESCPDQFTSAESMLQKSEALYAEGEDDEMKIAAQETVKLAEIAKECSIAEKAAANAAPKVDLGSLPEELANFKETVFFYFNDNSIGVDQTGTLKEAASFINKYQGEVQFWVLLSSHADRPGNPKANYNLSRRRGIVTRNYLISHGVEADRVVIKPMGEHDANEADKKEIKNADFRKVEITLLPFSALTTIKVGSPFFYETKGKFDKFKKYY